MANRAVVLLLGLSACLAASNGVPDWKALYEGHRWFELRDAVDRAKVGHSERLHALERLRGWTERRQRRALSSTALSPLP